MKSRTDKNKRLAPILQAQAFAVVDASQAIPLACRKHCLTVVFYQLPLPPQTVYVELHDIVCLQIDRLRCPFTSSHMSAYIDLFAYLIQKI